LTKKRKRGGRRGGNGEGGMGKGDQNETEVKLFGPTHKQKKKPRPRGKPYRKRGV